RDALKSYCRSYHRRQRSRRSRIRPADAHLTNTASKAGNEPGPCRGGAQMNWENELPDRHRITNCHAHTFTHEHSPDRFLPWPIVPLTNFAPFRRVFIWVARTFWGKRRGTVARYAEILATSFAVGQRGVFAKVQGSYPEGTRFVVLPMD